MKKLGPKKAYENLVRSLEKDVLSHLQELSANFRMEVESKFDRISVTGISSLIGSYIISVLFMPTLDGYKKIKVINVRVEKQIDDTDYSAKGLRDLYRTLYFELLNIIMTSNIGAEVSQFVEKCSTESYIDRGLVEHFRLRDAKNDVEAKAKAVLDKLSKPLDFDE